MTYAASYPALWDQAALAYDGEEASTLERRLPSDAWLVPDDITLDRDGDRLVWNSDSGHRVVRDESGVLSQFVKLADAPSERILQYAMRWGVLLICGHGLPCTHNMGPSWLDIGMGQGMQCVPLKVHPDPIKLEADRFRKVYPDLFKAPPDALKAHREAMAKVLDDPYLDDPLIWEPLESWRSLSRQAGAILNVAARLHLGEKPSEREWKVAMGAETRGNEPWERIEFSAFGPQMLATQIQRWLDVGNVRPTVSFQNPVEWSISLGGHLPGIFHSHGGTQGLFASLALHLAFSVARAESLSICSACGQAYTRRRRAKTGQRNYCDTCRENGAPWRLAQQTRRAKLRG